MEQSSNKMNLPEITGLFGCHITVKNANDGRTPSKEQVEKFQSCLLHNEVLKGCKPVLVLYPSEDFYPIESIRMRPQELMTSSYHSGKRSDVLSRVLQMSQALEEEGFELLRVKLEAMANCKNVEIDCDNSNDVKYFEYHTKIYLRSDEEERQLCHLDELLIKEGVARSQNLLGKHYEKCGHLLTFRWFQPITKAECDTIHKEFLKKLETHFASTSVLEIAESEKEYAVYDSNIFVDQGWAPIAP